MNSKETLVHDVAQRNGLSEGAVTVLLSALESSGYTMAQFNHPELGGMGQWSGGMTMIGDASNAELKAKVQSVCSDLAKGMKSDKSDKSSPTPTPALSSSLNISEQGAASTPGSAKKVSTNSERSLSEAGDRSDDKNWWPDTFGAISSSGSQNGCDYVYSRETSRLAIRQDSEVIIYDTGEHEIFGVAQEQGHSTSLKFESQLGPVNLDDLPRLAKVD